MIRFTGPDLRVYGKGVYDYYTGTQLELLGGGKVLAQLYPGTSVDRTALRELGRPDGIHAYLADPATGRVEAFGGPNAWELGYAVCHKETGEVYLPCDDVHGRTGYVRVPDGVTLVFRDSDGTEHEVENPVVP